MKVKKVLKVNYEFVSEVENLEMYVVKMQVDFEKGEVVISCFDGDLDVVFVSVVKVIECIYIVFFMVYNILEFMNFFVNVIVDKVELVGFMQILKLLEDFVVKFFDIFVENIIVDMIC